MSNDVNVTPAKAGVWFKQIPTYARMTLIVLVSGCRKYFGRQFFHGTNVNT